MAIIIKSLKKCCQGCGEKGTLHALLVGMQIGAATVENSMEVHQKIKNGATLLYCHVILSESYVKNIILCLPISMMDDLPSDN